MLCRTLLSLPLYLALLTFSAAASAASPDDLSEWQDWVLADHPDATCPWVMGQEGERACVWPGMLDMELLPSGLRFSLPVEVLGDEALVPIPGEDRYWPGLVTVNQRPAPLVRKDGRPYLALTRGRHTVAGRFNWRRAPGSLLVPPDIALVSLSQDGRELPVNRRKGRVVFAQQGSPQDSPERDSLQVEVYRALFDNIPVELETRVQLSVSGKPREVKIGRLGWAGTQVTALRSPLPARIESDGDLRIQLVPGEHTIIVNSRFTTDVQELKTERRGADWPALEYVSFESNPDLRQVKLSGATSVDTSQVDIPVEWSDLPTYKLAADTVLTLTTEFRGDHSPLANQLEVQRTLWLDFDGEGLTALDFIQGAMYRDWRLNSATDTQIGRATVEGQPILVTEDAGNQGIEVRAPTINLLTVSRVDATSHFSAVGWQAQADQFRASLHTPPGWRVLHASGVDAVRGTWISKWDLWDIFLLLITIAATRKLLGLRVAVLAGVALVLAYHEGGAPTLLFPVLLLVLALLPVLGGKLKSFTSVIGAGLCLTLVLAVIAFAVTSFRLAIYPSLEQQGVGRYDYTAAQDRFIDGRSGKLGVAQDAVDIALASQAPRALEEVLVTARKATEYDDAPRYQLDDNDRVQTGPGLPTWLWNTIALNATGPVTAEDRIKLVFSSPLVTSLWRVLSVFLVGAYAGLLVIAVVKLLAFRNGSAPAPGGAAAALVTAALLLGALGYSPSPMAQGYPDPSLLEELERRLLQPPDCIPNCSALNQGRITATEDELTIRFLAYVDADIQLPVPRGREGWQITDIRVDGVSRPSARKSGRVLAIFLDKGHHSVEITGVLRGDQASIVFPLPIANTQAMSEHWSVEGLVDGGIPSRSLSLRAKTRDQSAEVDTLIPDAIEPLVNVHRTFVLGKQWRLHTVVSRIAPESGPISVSIPLLDIEKVLSRDLTIVDGRAQLQFSDRVHGVRWESALDPQDALNLVATESDNYVETWSIIPSSLWRIQYEGLAPVKDGGEASTLHPLWRPWPGERLDVAVSRPVGIQGQTHTTEEATLTYVPGAKLQKSTLELSILSSLGEDYTVGLPPDAEVLSVALDGQSMNLPTGNRVTVPLQPGVQSLVVEFQQRGSLGWFSRSPTVELPDGATNIGIVFQLPKDRWPLYLSGPPIGPAMLYWGVLCVILIGAVALTVLARRLSIDLPIGLAGWLLLGLGLSTVNSYGVIAAVIFFFAMYYRSQMNPAELSPRSFKLLQVALVVWTLLTGLTLVAAIPAGLLSSPDMKVVGNGSWSHFYNYYQDRAGADSFPTVQVISINLAAYRVVMLLWSLWLATQLIKWAGWWWGAYSQGGAWVVDQAESTGRGDVD